MNRIKRLDVLYHDRKVGTLAVYKEYLTAFEYDKDWLHDGFFHQPIFPAFAFRSIHSAPSAI